MPKFYDNTYKWRLYEAYRAGHTITELCNTSGITDKPLREWFGKFEHEYTSLKSIGTAVLHRRNKRTQVGIKNKRLNCLSYSVRLFCILSKRLSWSCVHRPSFQSMGPIPSAGPWGSESPIYITICFVHRRKRFMKNMTKNSSLRFWKFAKAVKSALVQKKSGRDLSNKDSL